MHGFKIAVATKDKALEDLISFGTDITSSGDDSEQDSDESSVIDSAEIFFDTLDDNVKQKSGSMLARITIAGNVPQNPKFMKKFRKLTEWTRDKTSETQYRDICIAIKSSETAFQVVYTFKEVFVLDYKEIYTSKSGEGSDRFELKLTQRENNMNKIDILSDWPSDWEWARKG